MNWLDAMRPEIDAKIKAMLAGKTFSPDLLFDFDHVKAAVEIVEAAINETQVVAEQVTHARAIDAVHRAGTAAATGQPFSFIEEGVMTGNGSALLAVHMTFPRILRGSLFIAICSHVEHVLRQWCRWLHREWSLAKPLGRKARRESDLQNCMRYLRDDAALAVADYEQWDEWRIIDTYRVARNCLTHDGGIVPDESVAVLASSSEFEVIEPGLISDERMLGLRPTTCSHAAVTAKTFFDRLSKIGAQDPRAKSPPR